MPPLRERKNDIQLLARYFFNQYSQSMTKSIKDISPEAMDMMLTYLWPGNVRELRNVIERAIVVCDKITLRDLSFPFKGQGKQFNGDSLEDVEKIHIDRILNRTGWQISKASEILNIDRTTLYNKIKKYNLKK